jgi:hypothetical protein
MRTKSRWKAANNVPISPSQMQSVQRHRLQLKCKYPVSIQDLAEVLTIKYEGDVGPGFRLSLVDGPCLLQVDSPYGFLTLRILHVQLKYTIGLFAGHISRETYPFQRVFAFLICAFFSTSLALSNAPPSATRISEDYQQTQYKLAGDRTESGIYFETRFVEIRHGERMKEGSLDWAGQVWVFT